MRYYRGDPIEKEPTGDGRKLLEEYLHKLLWRRAAHWMYLRWWVRQDRAHWPAVTKMPR